ncbi:nicotinamide N-methyltransferase-like [Engystomops pustulosus]
MDSSANRHYLLHDFDSRKHLDYYFSGRPEMVFKDDYLVFPIESLTKTFTLGHIRGDILIDLSASSFIHHLYAACEFFKHTIVLKVKDRCIMELKRWVDTRTGAFDWCHVAQLHADIKGISEQIEDKQGKVRSALQHVIKCNLGKENMTEPIDLPPADCIISALLLEHICKDQDDYIKYIRKFSRLLKPGGHIIIFGAVGALYLTVGEHKIQVFNYDEEFARKTLVGEGFVIDSCEVKNRSNVSDLIDYVGVIFIAAHKEK